MFVLRRDLKRRCCYGSRMPQVERWDRSGWALAGAVALHVVAFVLVRHTGKAPSGPAVSRVVAHDALAVELVDPVVERAAAHEPAGPPARRGFSSVQRLSRRPPRPALKAWI
jgi:hypothetical protein